MNDPSALTEMQGAVIAATGGVKIRLEPVFHETDAPVPWGWWCYIETPSGRVANCSQIGPPGDALAYALNSLAEQAMFNGLLGGCEAKTVWQRCHRQPGHDGKHTFERE